MSGKTADAEELIYQQKMRKLPRIVGRFFGREAVSELSTTRIRLEISPETAWKRIIFYEEVPGRAPWLLRRFLPSPVRTEGEKSSVGAEVYCFYEGGSLLKRITAIVHHHIICFEVLRQELGIENCLVAERGSYEIKQHTKGSEVTLATRYRAYLHPRWLWRPLEKVLLGQLHRHILNGMTHEDRFAESVVSESVQESGAA